MRDYLTFSWRKESSWRGERRSLCLFRCQNSDCEDGSDEKNKNSNIHLNGHEERNF